jgi:hypothetical protein
LAGVVVLLGAAGASAKDFGPGDLRVCNAHRCVPITRRPVLPLLGSFYYSGPKPETVAAPRFGSRAFELRFRNGYATGIVAGPNLDRFLSYGVHLERFRARVWYRIPPLLVAELRRLATGLEPLRVTPAVLARSF